MREATLMEELRPSPFCLTIEFSHECPIGHGHHYQVEGGWAYSEFWEFTVYRMMPWAYEQRYLVGDTVFRICWPDLGRLEERA